MNNNNSQNTNQNNYFPDNNASANRKQQNYVDQEKRRTQYYQNHDNRQYNQPVANQSQYRPVPNRNTSDDPQDIRLLNQNTDFRVTPSSEPKKKGISIFLKVFVAIILIISLLISGLFIGLYTLCAKTQYIADSDNSSESFLELIFEDKSHFNILLIGTDKENNNISRADTIMLVTIDKENEKIKLTSFMRDLWVTIPGHGKSRINSAFAKGGPELLIKTIKENFRVNIDNYMLVDFEMFVELIDNIGGITVDITDKEAEFINRTTREEVISGSNKLNGKEALVYCRIRKLDSDFMRTKRQRKVMTAIVEKFKSQNISSTIKAGTSVLPLIQTNISPLKLTLKSVGMISVIKYPIEQMRVPAENLYTEQKINGQQVLVPDIERNVTEINNFIG